MISNINLATIIENRVVLSFAWWRGYHLLLRLLGYDVAAEEEQDTRGTLPCINISSKVTVTVTFNLCLLRPLVVATVVKSPCNLPEHSLYCCHMSSGFSMNLLMYPNWERQIWPWIHQIAQRTSNGPILRSINSRDKAWLSFNLGSIETASFEYHARRGWRRP